MAYDTPHKSKLKCYQQGHNVRKFGHSLFICSYAQKQVPVADTDPELGGGGGWGRGCFVLLALPASFSVISLFTQYKRGPLP